MQDRPRQQIPPKENPGEQQIARLGEKSRGEKSQEEEKGDSASTAKMQIIDFFGWVENKMEDMKQENKIKWEPR